MDEPSFEPKIYFQNDHVVIENEEEEAEELEDGQGAVILKKCTNHGRECVKLLTPWRKRYEVNDSERKTKKAKLLILVIIGLALLGLSISTVTLLHAKGSGGREKMHGFDAFYEILKNLSKGNDGNKADKNFVSEKNLTAETHNMTEKSSESRPIVDFNGPELCPSNLQSIQLQQNLIQLQRESQVKQGLVEKLKKNYTNLQETFLYNQEKQKRLEVTVNYLEENPVPLGFIYVEYPGQLPPATIFPQLTWADCTILYAGLFFRAEGGGSSPFGSGSVQEATTRYVTRMEVTYGGRHPRLLDIPMWGWSEFGFGGQYYSSGSYGHELVRFHMSDAEIRPNNTAIRIWKRIA